MTARGPRASDPRLPGWRPLEGGRAFCSCLALTVVCWVLLSPAVTLDFGAAVLPFSWPVIGALPITVSVLLALAAGLLAAIRCRGGPRVPRRAAR